MQVGNTRLRLVFSTFPSCSQMSVVFYHNAVHCSLFAESNGQEDLKSRVKRIPIRKYFFFSFSANVNNPIIIIIALLVLDLHLFALDKLKTGPRPTLFSKELINGY